MADYASESGHWYCQDGTPCYTIIGANGNERPTTLRDARKLNLLPSVTGIIGLAAKPGLEAWKTEQVLLACLTLPRLDGETDASFMARVREDSKQQGKRAAEKGEDIHAAIECHHRGDRYPERWQPWVAVACETMEGICGKRQWLAEKSYAYKQMYGCRIDLHSTEWMIDVKTKEQPKDAVIYDEHLMQLAANARATGLPIKRHGILFVGRETPWTELVEVSEKDIAKGWSMFMALFMYWQAKTQYFPVPDTVAA